MKFVNRPPSPLCVGVKPVPCAMPPTRFVPLNVGDVRYGCGSWPASPYDRRTLPNVRKLGLYMFVNVHAALAFGNKLRRFVCAERRRPVVAQRAGQVQLVVQVERRLPEVRLVVDLRLIIARRIARQRVEDTERLRAR